MADSSEPVTKIVIRVAIDAPVMGLFDYLAPAQGPLRAGQRVLVPFRTGKRIGVVRELVDESPIAATRLRGALAILDAEPLLDPALMNLLDWASRYYQHPPGEVYAAALPRLLRQGREARSGTLVWQITGTGHDARDAGEPRRAAIQKRLLDALAANDEGLDAGALAAVAGGWQAAVRTLERKGWVERRHIERARLGHHHEAEAAPVPTPAQAQAIATVLEGSGSASDLTPFLLEGVTGSGKTEVYLRVIDHMLGCGRQSLVLVPEIGLVPQLLARARQRFPGTEIALLHSGLSDRERLAAWHLAQSGRAGIILGTRSAVFAPLPAPGLIVVDEEHDLSLKQQEGFRYSARDIAVWRARQLGVPVILGSATPSLETLANVEAGRYRRLQLPERTGEARPPTFHLIDLRRNLPTDGLTQPLIEVIRRHLETGGQVLLYLNRRGYAPTLMCPSCGRSIECRHCDARMVLHRADHRVTCHHCGATRRAPTTCPGCGGELFAVGQGTERLEAAIAGIFPDWPLVRIDRDTTRARGEIERRLTEADTGRARILLGTQMLTKGHDFPGVTLVGIIDADQGLFGTDFRASEKLAQVLVQVAGRAGRRGLPGEVWIQTLFPHHPLLQLLLREGYGRFAEAALAERRAAGWPPFAHLALLRAEAPEREPALRFLRHARADGEPLLGAQVRLLGPAPAPMEKRAGRYRAQLLAEASSRPALQKFLAGWREIIVARPEAKRIRWSLDVDPVELF